MQCDILDMKSKKIIIKPKLCKVHKVYELVRRSTQALATRNSTCSEGLHSMI